MKHLSTTDLKAFIKDFQHYMGGPVSDIAQLYALSAEVLSHLVGKAWVQDNVFGLAPIDSFLRSNSDITEDKFKHSDRVVSLAEMLFHFQGIDPKWSCDANRKVSSRDQSKIELQNDR